MATQVLLMADVQDLGVEGDVVSVSDGFARNYLFPRKLAAPVNEATRRTLAALKARREEERRAALETARQKAMELSKISCTIPMKVTAEGKLYGSVGIHEILDALAAQGVVLDKTALLLESPIRELGVFRVKVRLHPEVEGAIKVWVVEE